MGRPLPEEHLCTISTAWSQRSDLHFFWLFFSDKGKPEMVFALRKKEKKKKQTEQKPHHHHHPPQRALTRPKFVPKPNEVPQTPETKDGSPKQSMTKSEKKHFQMLPLAEPRRGVRQTPLLTVTSRRRPPAALHHSAVPPSLRQPRAGSLPTTQRQTLLSSS